MPKVTWTIMALTIAAAFLAMSATVLPDSQAQASTMIQSEAVESPWAVRIGQDEPLAADPSAQPNGSSDGDHHGWPGGWWVIMPIAMIAMIVFWAVVIGVAVWALRQFTDNRSERGTPLDIAKERYARGEIDHEEFERMRRDLA